MDGPSIRGQSTPIFVFGSNLAGRHGAGAAKWALLNRGAIYGVGDGRQGDSYAIPTKDGNLTVLRIHHIEVFVKTFLRYAEAHPDLTFQLTPIGCGLAGYKHSEIGPLFDGAPPNVMLPEEFKPYAANAETQS